METTVLRTKAAAAYLGISGWKLRRLAKAGRITYLSDGDRTSALLFLAADLDAYLQRIRHAPAAWTAVPSGAEAVPPVPEGPAPRRLGRPIAK
jgi:excisionase family DNA binding protein